MSDRPLPETIPAGEYVLLLSKPEGEIVTATVSYHRDDWWLNHRDDWWLNVNSGMALITEAQARHLLAMPGRPHDDRLDGPGCGGGSDAEHCSCWLNEEKPCCRCRYDGDEAITCAAPDPTRAHWTEAQRQPGQERGMRRPDADGGGWYMVPSDTTGALWVRLEDHSMGHETQPIAPDGTVPVAPEEQA